MMKKLMNLIAAICIALSMAVQAEVAVIVHPSVADSVDKKTIAKIFLGKTSKLPGGSEVTPVNLAEDDALRLEFEKSVLNKKPSQIKSYWSKQIFTGKGTPPAELETTNDVVERVKSDSSSIGYVSPAEVTDEVRVIATF